MTPRSSGATRPATRDDCAALPLEVAPRLLGALLSVRVADGPGDAPDLVTIRLTEVEAYHGLGTGDVPDPGSHARSGRSARNSTMWGEPGHLYVYLSHGIHSCVNIVCAPVGVAGGVLLRAGEVVAGQDAASRRRGMSVPSRDLARGPGRLGRCVGLLPSRHDGLDAISGAVLAGAEATLELPITPHAAPASGPRVGVAGEAGTAAFPWRFWIPGDPTVSAFRWGRGAADAAGLGTGGAVGPPVLD